MLSDYANRKDTYKLIYFDNSATSKPCAESVAAAEKAMKDTWGNPSSLHGLGVAAEGLLNSARESVAEALCCLPEEITFTSGATESNNTALFSAALTKGKRRKKIITTAAEHPSISEPLKRLSEQGFEIVKLSPGKDGVISKDEVLRQIDKNTLMVSVMLVNNETGAIFDVPSIFKAVKAADSEVYTHTDAVQGFMKLNINAKKLNADMISVSGHKVYAPKGVGALYIKKGLNLKPFIVGGGQERAKRSGTESTPIISAFGAAVKAHICDMDERYKKVQSLREALKNGISALDKAYIHEFENTLPYVASLTLEGYKSETLLHFLEERGIYVSSGSACSKGKKSEVLKSFLYDDKALDSTIRISFCADNTEAEVIALTEALKEAQSTLCKIK